MKSFSGANADQMKQYVEPTLEDKPDAIILHVGTNERQNNKKNEVQIAEEITGLAKSIEQEKMSIAVSCLIVRNAQSKKEEGLILFWLICAPSLAQSSIYLCF